MEPTRKSYLDAIFTEENISHAGPQCDETGEPIRYFSYAPCETCNSNLAGYRYEFSFIQAKTNLSLDYTICLDCFLDFFIESEPEFFEYDDDISDEGQQA